VTDVIRMKGVSKKYSIYHEESCDKFALDVWSRARNFIPRLILQATVSNKAAVEEFWSLKNIDLDVKEGDKLGIIGRNGAGKSTLLKVLSRITEPTSGEVGINGRIASLLEVGTGFHPELTGRENIFLNGAILGMRRKAISSRFESIVEFSEIGRFLDTPVKRYSSGMYVRLAFAIAAHLKPDILLVDEVLAVGDLAFQKKCLGSMDEMSSSGRTIIFVSHNMSAVSALCDRGVCLDSGEVLYDGSVAEAVEQYISLGRSTEIKNTQFSGKLSEVISFNEVRLNGKNQSGTSVSPDEELVFEVFGESGRFFPKFRMTLAVHVNGVLLFTVRDCISSEPLLEGKFKYQIVLPSFLLRPGHYGVAVGGNESEYSDWIHGTDVFEFFVRDEWSGGCEKTNAGLVNVEPLSCERVLI